MDWNSWLKPVNKYPVLLPGMRSDRKHDCLILGTIMKERKKEDQKEGKKRERNSCAQRYDPRDSPCRKHTSRWQHMRIIDRAADVWAGPVPRNLSASQLLCFHITAGSGLMCLQNVRSNVLKYVYLFLCNPATVYDAIVILALYKVSCNKTVASSSYRIITSLFVCSA